MIKTRELRVFFYLILCTQTGKKTPRILTGVFFIVLFGMRCTYCMHGAWAQSLKRF